MPTNYGDTPRYQIQYPFSSASTNVPGDLETPLTTLDSIITPTYSGTASARPTAGTYTDPNATGTTGRRYYATDTGQITFDTGSSWINEGPINTVTGNITQSTPGNSGGAGSTGFSADAGHTHPREGWGVAGNYKVAAINAAAGSSGNVAQADHVHPMFSVGVVYPWIGTSVPSGAIQLNGQVVSRTTYPVLFSICGTTWNTGGEGSSNFRLPNLTNMTLGGAGSLFSVGQYYGASSTTLSTSQLPSHTHSISDPGHLHGINDPGHNHTPAPGYNQVIEASSKFGSSTPGSENLTFTNEPTSTSGTGISIQSASTGISGTNATGSGGSVSLIQPTAGVLFITGAG